MVNNYLYANVQVGSTVIASLRGGEHCEIPMGSYSGVVVGHIDTTNGKSLVISGRGDDAGRTFLAEAGDYGTEVYFG